MKLYEVLCLLFVLKRWRSEAVSKPAPSRSTRKRQMRSASGTDSSSRTPRHRMLQSRNDSVEAGHSNIPRSLRSTLDDLTIFCNIYFIRSTSFLDSSPQLQVLHLLDFASLSNVVIFLLELLNALLGAFFFHRWWESLPVALPEAARNNRTWHQPPSMAPLPLPCTQPPRERGWALQIYESQCLFFAEESFWTLLKHVEAVQGMG